MFDQSNFENKNDPSEGLRLQIRGTNHFQISLISHFRLTWKYELFRASYNGTNKNGEVIPSGPDYSAFYIFAEHFGLSFTMKVEDRCIFGYDSNFTGGCKHIVGKFALTLIVL